MFNNRKAQGLSVHTIIVAIIGLIILVAIVLMLTGKLGSFGEDVDEVASCGNICKVAGRIEGGGVGKLSDGKPACTVTGEVLVTSTCCCAPKQ